jgi:hypothetical protein
MSAQRRQDQTIRSYRDLVVWQARLGFMTPEIEDRLNRRIAEVGRLPNGLRKSLIKLRGDRQSGG